MASSLLCALVAVAGGAVLIYGFVPEQSIRAGGGQGEVFRFVEVRVNRAYNFFGKDPEDKLLFKPGVEVIKGEAGKKLEVGASRSWYTHKLVLTIEAPETVKDGQPVTLKGVAEATMDLRHKDPSTSTVATVGIVFRYQKGDGKELTGTAANPIRAGTYTLKAESTVTVTPTNGDGTFAGAGAGAGASERIFYVSASSGIVGSQGLIEAHFVYRKDDGTIKPDPKPEPRTHKCPQTFERNWNTTWGLMPIRVQGNTASGTYTKSRGLHGPGSFTATISGRVLDAKWKDDDGRTQGTFQMILSEDGCTFSGGAPATYVTIPPGAGGGNPTGQDPHLGGTAGHGPAGKPWETPHGKDCFEKWIALATKMLNAYDGGPEHNGRKPWSFNKYGLLEATGIKSAFAPDNFTQYGNNKYWWMWDYYDTDAFGQYPRASILNKAGVPALRDYVRRCAGHTTTTTTDPPPAGDGMILLAPDLIVPKGALVTVPIHLINARDVSNLDFKLEYLPQIASARPDAARGSIVDEVFQYKLNQPGLFKCDFAKLTPFTGRGTVAGFHFDAIGPGRSRTPLTLSVHRVNDPKGTALPITIINGSITIYDPADLTDPNNPNNPDPPGGPGQSRFQPTCSGTGRQTINDAQCCLKMWVGLLPQGLHMDLDGSGVVDSRDAVIVLQNIAAELSR